MKKKVIYTGVAAVLIGGLTFIGVFSQTLDMLDKAASPSIPTPEIIVTESTPQEISIFTKTEDFTISTLKPLRFYALQSSIL